MQVCLLVLAQRTRVDVGDWLLLGDMNFARPLGGHPH